MMKATKVDKDFHADMDLRTLIEAEKIKKDKTRFSAAMKKRNELMKDMKNVNQEVKS